jgi:WD40 repeat protein
MHRRSVLAALAVSGLGGCLRLASEGEASATARTTTDSGAPTDERGPETDAEDGDVDTEDAESTTTDGSAVAEPELDWWTLDGEPRRVTIVDETAYVSGSGGSFEGVQAFDVRTGDRRWDALQSKQFSSTTPTHDDGSLYVGSSDDDPQVVELDAETGRTLSQFAPGIDGAIHGVFALPPEFVLVTTGRSYQDGYYVYLLARDDLDLVWERHFPGDEYSATPTDAATANGTGILANPNRTIAFDLDDGTNRWALEAGSFAVERVDDALVYVHRDRVAARPVGEQVVEWSTRSPGRDVTLHPDDDVFVVATQDGVRTYDLETGERTWRTQFTDIEYGQGLFDPRPTTGVRDDTVWVWSREALCGFDLTTGDQTTMVSLPTEPDAGHVADAGLACWLENDDEALYGAGAGPL